MGSMSQNADGPGLTYRFEGSILAMSHMEIFVVLNKLQAADPPAPTYQKTLRVAVK